MRAGTIHLVYPHGTWTSCPDAIGRNLGERLAAAYEVRYYDWDEINVIRPTPGDILIGHPHPAPWTVFRRSARQRGWRRVVALAPFHHGDMVQVAFLDPVIRCCDLYLAITGNYWFQTTPQSPFRHWVPKMRQMHLAVDRNDFPILKTAFNPAGSRRFVYIGHSGWTKNTGYLSAIASAMPDASFSWIGSGAADIPGVAALGTMNFATAAAREVIAAHDFLVTVGRADANPTTILEAMAWGLIPVCTQESGYVGYSGIVNVPLDDVPGAVAVLRQLQWEDADLLCQRQMENWGALDATFNWDRFAADVIDAIECPDSPTCGTTDLPATWAIRRASFSSPYAPWRLRNLLRSVRPLVRPLRRRFFPRTKSVALADNR